MSKHEEHEDRSRHSDTVEFLRGLLVKDQARSDYITIWLMLGISSAGLFFVAAIVYLILKGAYL